MRDGPAAVEPVDGRGFGRGVDAGAIVPRDADVDLVGCHLWNIYMCLCVFCGGAVVDWVEGR